MNPAVKETLQFLLNFYVAICAGLISMNIGGRALDWVGAKMSGKEKSEKFVDADGIEFGHGLSLGILGVTLAFLRAAQPRCDEKNKRLCEEIIGKIEAARQRCANGFAQKNFGLQTAEFLPSLRSKEEVQDSMLAKAYGMTPSQLKAAEMFKLEQVMEGTRDMEWREEISREDLES